jgi:hypothetical protein
MRRLSLTLLAAGAMALALAGCSDDAPEQTTATQPAAPQTAPTEVAPAPEPERPPETEAELNARADAAVQEQRLFAPPGDNSPKPMPRTLSPATHSPICSRTR